MRRQKCARFTPLCHFVTSPPQGGRLTTSARLTAPQARPLPRSNRIVGPLAGDAAGPKPVSPLEGEAHRIWSTGGGSGLPLLPSGRSAERMRGDEGAARHSFCASRPPHPALRATFSPLGRRGIPLRAPLKIQMESPSLEGREEPSAQRSNRSCESIAATNAGRAEGGNPGASQPVPEVPHELG